MNLDTFEDLCSDQEKQLVQKLQCNPYNLIEQRILPSYIGEIEKQINSNRNSLKTQFNVKGFILEPIRRQDQVMYKPALSKPNYLHFRQEEDENVRIFDEHFPLIHKRIESNSKEEYMFITIQLLRRSQYSNYFMYLPDVIFLNLPDYYDRIKRPIDMYTIGNKILRHSYSNNNDFEIDVVTMINNFKIYFMYDHELFGIAIKFQIQFWQIYEKQLEKFRMAKKQYKEKIQKPLRAAAVKRYKAPVKKYSLNQKKVLNQRLRDLSASNINHFNKIINFIKDSCNQNIRNGKINIEDLKNEHCEQIERMFGQFQIQNKQLQLQMNNMQNFRVEHHKGFIQSLRMDDIVGASEDQDS